MAQSSIQSNDAPLGIAVEAAFGKLEELPEDATAAIWRRGIRNWHLLVSVMIDDEHGGSDSLQLSSTQLHSFRLLWEWWTAIYQEPAFSTSNIMEMAMTGARLNDVNLTDDDGHLDTRRSAAMTQTFRSSRRKYRVPQPNAYDDRLLALFKREFCITRRQSYQDHVTWNAGSFDFRTEAFISAHQQWTAHSLYQKLTHAHLSHDQRDMPQVAPWRPCAASTLPLRACPWLGDTVKRPENMPYFLWDVNQRTTVKTSDLAGLPEYTAVSHTWGRWRRDDLGDISVPGALWPVPGNRRFDVKQIPDLLEQIPTGTPYVWFDLVCIPQQDSDIARGEIARQAEIFRSAKHAVAWLNDLENLEVLASTMSWIYLRMLGYPDGSSENKSQADLLASISEDFKSRSTGLANVDKLSFNTWFTSLWTLQELYLRHDMWICDQHWKYLSMAEGIPLTMAGLATAVRWCGDIFEEVVPGRKAPSEYGNLQCCLIELQFWLNQSGLARMASGRNASPIGILTLGDRRRCTSNRRAEAIMSACGATEWYQEAIATGSGDPHTDLVLRLYPLQFVREVCRRWPGDFFCAAHQAIPNDKHATQVPREDLRGSMLPFSAAARRDDNGLYTVGDPMQDHSSVRKWEICHDGSVTINVACILASPSISQTGPLRGLRSRIVGPNTEDLPRPTSGDEDNDSDGQLFDLDEVLKTMAQSQRHVYAVIVKHTGEPRSTYQGVLLEELRGENGSFASVTDRKELVKIGIFAGHLPDQFTLPEASLVDWKVI